LSYDVRSAKLLSLSRGNAMMHQNIGIRRRLGSLLACLWLSLVVRAVAGDVVLFTASTDYSGGTNPISVPNDPVNQNPYIPSISPSVTVSPDPALLDGSTAGPLNGITYGPLAYNGNTGGTTGFVNVSYTFASTGVFQLVWEVSNVTGSSGQSALATDNVLLDGAPLFNFLAGGLGVLPTGLTGAGTYGTSGAISGLSPSGGDAAFAWIDSTGNQTPVFDTVDGKSASQLYSTTFTAAAGEVISLDAAFLTNDGAPYDDYGIVAIDSVPTSSSVPLPSALAQVAVSIAILWGWRNRRSFSLGV
jgi:hypothetical protein